MGVDPKKEDTSAEKFEHPPMNGTSGRVKIDADVRHRGVQE